VDKMIEVRYAGVVVGRSAIIRELDTRGLFLGITEPMPVGTPVVLRISGRSAAEDVEGKIDAVSESQDMEKAGMRVRFANPQAATVFGTPGQAAAEPVEPVLPAAVAPAAVESRPQAAPARATAPAGGASAPAGVASAAPGSPRPVVIDASADDSRASETPAAEVSRDDEGELSLPEGGGDSERIPAPDPSAFSSGGGGKRGRRNRRR
jgi:hypothetical protein